MNILTLETNERKNLAMFAMFGGALVFSGYAIAGLFLLKASPAYIFYLALAAHVQIFSIMAGFVAQLVKRRLSASKDGVSIIDEGVTVDASTTNITN
jgi:hypothetical protein